MDVEVEVKAHISGGSLFPFAPDVRQPQQGRLQPRNSVLQSCGSYFRDVRQIAR